MLVLELLTDPEVIKYTHLNNAVAFRSKLTCEQYAEREWTISALRNQRDLTTNTGVYHFALRDLSIKVEKDDLIGNIVSSCETNNRKSWRIDPKGDLKDVVGICIGSVYTLPQHRKKGYGNALITKLNEYWDEKLGSNGFMFLYSEVGEYYSRFGYKSFNVPVYHIKGPEDQHILNVNVNYIKPEEYSSIIKRENLLLKEQLIKESKEVNHSLVSLQLDIDTLTWFHLRDKYINSKVCPDLKVERYGALLKDGSDDIIVWLHDWNDNSIFILYLKYSSLDSFLTLLYSALKEANDLNLPVVNIWESSLKLGKEEVIEYLESSLNTTVSKLNDSLSAIRTCDGTTELDWKNNEKWCWF